MSLPIPTRNRGIVKKSAGSAIVSDIPIPVPRDGYMLVKTAAVALNPADWTDIDHEGGYEGCIVGLDYAGTVVGAAAAGGLTKKKFEIGDRVCGPVHGCNAVHDEDGAFAEYIVVKADLQMHVPPHMSLEDAATLGCGVLTIGQGLYQSLGLPLPKLDGGNKETGKWILIYGGSSATGTLAIQFAKLSGFKVVTTCSPRNFDLVSGLGADVVLDYVGRFPISAPVPQTLHAGVYAKSMAFLSSVTPTVVAGSVPQPPTPFSISSTRSPRRR
jgi:NADPH:quinone reductase-like Zn-dependent oxidoreductase